MDSAWYSFMEQRGTPIRRWQRPFQDLLHPSMNKAPLTLVQIHSSLSAPTLDQQEQGWVEQGNTLQRRQVMEPTAQARLSLQLARQVRTVIALEKQPPNISPDTFLEAVYLAYQNF